MKAAATRLFIGLAVAVFMSGTSSAFLFGLFGDDDDKPKRQELPSQNALPVIPYDVTVTGPDDSMMKDRVNQELTLIKKKDKGVPSAGVLQSRLQNDVAKIHDILQAYGYYDGTVNGQIVQGSPMRVTITITQGALYHIGTFKVVWQDGRVPPDAKVESAAGQPATGVNILATGDRVVADLKDKGYFDATVTNRRAVLDHATGLVDITDTISSGVIVHVGGFQVSGKTALSAYRVSELAELDVGELLTPKRLKEAETTLQQSALFDLAKADPVGTSPERTIHYTVNDRLIHTLSGSLQYSLQDGAAIELSWEDRNLAGDAEKLTTALTLGTETQELNVAYREFDFWWQRHTLIATFDITRQNVDDHPYESAAVIGVLEQKLSKHLTIRYGGSLEYIRDEDQDHGGNYGLVGIRGELTYDDTNDLLDPTEGIRATARLQPYFSYNGDSKQFTIAEIIGSAYIPFDEQHKFVFATRARLGSILGASLDSVPYPKRFFAGGGGSIRGYGYERAGPIDEQNRPLGGTSVLELNEEFRWRINETFGAVVFVDGGGAFDSSTPFSSDMFIGTGVGVRYYSPIGPVRLDVATPLKKQPGDGSIDIYISIGQAF